MPTLTLRSAKFPGISFICPQMPETNRPGSYPFRCDIPYAVTVTTRQAIESQFESFPATVQRDMQLFWSDDLIESESETIDSYIETANSEDSIEALQPEAIEDLTALSDEDLDLIEVEISKLTGKAPSEVQNQMVATGGNPELPKLLRQEYLKRVIASKKIAKPLRDTAAELLQQL